MPQPEVRNSAEGLSPQVLLAMAKRLSEGKTREDVVHEMMTPHPIGEEVTKRLQAYEKFIGAPNGQFHSRYKACPVHYSLDLVIAVARDYEKASRLVAGGGGQRNAPGATFGLTYAHAGLVTLDDVRISSLPQKRSTFLVVDSRLVANDRGREAFIRCLPLIQELVDLQNHDVLHSINGRSKQFSDMDCHLRFGGVEFAPMVVHSKFVREVLLNDERISELGRKIADFVESVAAYTDLKERAYWISIALRNLLLVVPTNHTLVNTVLNCAKEKLFGDGTVTVARLRWDRFLARDFSLGDGPDTVPPMPNTTEAYNHGRESALRQWFVDYFSHHVPETAPTVSMPWAQFILLDVLQRAHGVFGVATATEGDESLAQACMEKFR